MLWYNLRQSQKNGYDCEVPSGVNWSTKEINVVVRLLSAVYTFLAFLVALFLIPWLFFMFIVVRICRILFIRWLEKNFNGLEFVQKTTVRTAVDTPRNQGIITALLTVRGPCQLHFIKNRIQADIVEREKNGIVVFPHLRTILTSRWGTYAWIRGSEKKFCIDNHIVLANTTFKGRPVSDSNIQDYISDIIAKLLPTDLPPWQITLIPTLQDKTYLLIRLHHLYLSEDKLSLGELLLLRGDEHVTVSNSDPWVDSSILSGVFRTPVVIPQVYEQACESLANWWNELLYEYDPIDNPNATKKPTIKTFIVLLTIMTVTVIKEYMKGENVKLNDLIKIEVAKRNISKKLFWSSFYNTFKPSNIIKTLFQFIWSTPISIIKFPIRLAKMIVDTPVYLYWLYLGHYVIKETLYLFKIFYTAPRVIFEEIFLPEYPCNVHQLQTMSFCGRKVVHWSDPIPLEMVKQIKWATSSTTSEVVMSAVSAALRNYFSEANYSVPKAVMTTCHFTPQEDLLAHRGQLTSGMLCLPLPTQTPVDDPLACLQALKHSLYKARSTQAPLYLASIYQIDYSLFTTIFPTLFAKACLYLLSRRYAVNVTQVDSTSRMSGNKTRQLLWGQRVEKIMYWRPPQANVGLSLTIISYGDTVQLGVMSDAQLSPHQSTIVTNFTSELYQLAERAGVPRIPVESSLPTNTFS
ncbi:uncharacterized protein LOC106673838 isoform X3 [Cimex lectularius]|uniref:O-acyltransferase WSD1 C-terminal domain-containing protein n=1 Tax=Cimex lectularius TaxID=79782 RepID=A0A8I6SD41_CIMLE|nr:uncharacterized protein LOC106673838 isoform X3 [Cimex lectularius]